MSQIELTVAVPVYNVEKYIRRCLDSIILQLGENSELLIVDDGSLDSSGIICDEYQQRHPSFIRVIHQENHGLAYVRNVCIKEARGEYVGLDITDKEAVRAAISEIKPDAIVHCAAWTAVDAAEDPENKSLVHRINAEGTRNIAEAAKAVDAKMVYLSTDYVFDGQGERPWQPDDKSYAPLNYYGQTKLEGELAVSETMDKYFIVRIAWVFGLNGKNFIKTMVNVGRNHDTVRVVNDQIGTPTYTYDLARLLVDMIETDKYGYYHATNEGGYISWYDFTCEIYRQMGMATKVVPVTTEEYGLSVAARPFNSRLGKSKLVEAGFEPLPDWKDAVSRYLKEADL